jgi:hypothetical protein
LIREYVNIEAHYNIDLGFWKMRKLKQSVKKRDARVIDVLPCGDNPPRFTRKTKETLRNGAIICTITFLTALGGNKTVVSLDMYQIVGLAIIPALTAFFSRLAFDFKVKPSD